MQYDRFKAFVAGRFLQSLKYVTQCFDNLTEQSASTCPLGLASREIDMSHDQLLFRRLFGCCGLFFLDGFIGISGCLSKHRGGHPEQKKKGCES